MWWVDFEKSGEVSFQLRIE